MYDNLIELMTNLSKEIGGYYFQNEDLGQFGVIKENVVFLYRFPSRDHIAAFSIMMAIPDLPAVEIYIDGQLVLVEQYLPLEEKVNLITSVIE